MLRHRLRGYQPSRPAMDAAGGGGGGGSGVAPALDGTPYNPVGFGTGTTTLGPTAVNLGCSNANDVIVLVYTCDTISGVAPSLASISGTNDYVGLTWSNLAGSNAMANVDSPNGAGTNPSIRVEIWWAKATAPVVTGNLTVTLSGMPDNATVSVFAVSGCGNPTAPWDVNGSLPVKPAAVVGPTVPSVSGISTTAPGTLIIAAVGASRPSGGQYADQTSSAPFTMVVACHGAPGNNYNALAYQVYGATMAQSGLTSSFGVSYNNWITLTHALVGT
jgi:hypothetical protein